jgi:hypothetical protein
MGPSFGSLAISILRPLQGEEPPSWTRYKFDTTRMSDSLYIDSVNTIRRRALNVEKVRESLIQGYKYLLLYLGF